MRSPNSIIVYIIERERWREVVSKGAIVIETRFDTYPDSRFPDRKSVV